MNNQFEHIINKIESVLKTRIKLEFYKKIVLAIGFLVFYFLLISIFESFFYFHETSRAILFFTGIIFTLLIFIASIFYDIMRWKKIPSEKKHFQVANEVGTYYPEIKDELVNSLQLYINNPVHFSNSLIKAAFNRAYNLCKDKDFMKVVDYQGFMLYLRKYFSFISISALVMLAVPSINKSLIRVLNFNTAYQSPGITFEIVPGHLEIPKGSNLVIKIKTGGGNPELIKFHKKNQDQPEYFNKNVGRDSLNTFIITETGVTQSFSYYAEADNYKSEIFQISVISNPVMQKLELSITPPRYSNLSPFVQNDNGNISVLKGSSIKVKVESSRNLSEAKIIFSDGSSKELKVLLNKAEGLLTASKNDSYKIIIKDEKGIENLNQIEYELSVLSDEFPKIDIAAPAEETTKGNINILPIIAKIKDDYGFSKLTFNYRLETSNYRTAEQNFTITQINLKNQVKEDEIYFNWDLGGLYLAEGETVSFFLEIFDNDFVSGPKSSRSQLKFVTVPSLNDLFAAADESQEDLKKELESTLRDTEKLSKELQKISDELKQDAKELSWQEKEKLESSTKKIEELLEKTSNAAEKLETLKKDLMNNNLLSNETLEKYNELQKLLEDLNNAELQAALKKMQEALQNVSRQNAQMSLEDLKANEEMIKKSIERTLNLLKRIQIEQKIDELVLRANDLSKKISEQAENIKKDGLKDKSANNSLEQKQESISNNIKDAEDIVEKLDEMMKSLEDMPKELMTELNKKLTEQKNQQISSDVKNALKKLDQQTSMSKLESLQNNMMQFSDQLQNIQAAMQQMNQTKTFLEMAKSLNNLIELSKDEESLKNLTSEISSTSSKLSQLAGEQSLIQDNLRRVTQSLSETAQKTFAITPEMGKAIGSANNAMNMAISHLINQNTNASESEQANAMKYINEAASLLKGSMQQMMNGGQGGGMMSLFQQLQKLSQQQMSLNQLTQMMNQGALSPEMAQQIQRLSQQQEIIRKSLEQLNKEAKDAGQSKRLASNLEKILEEMKEVVSELSSNTVNDDIVKQQDKILSRLLDAQKSISERDFEDNRISNTGKNIQRNSPISTLDSKTNLELLRDQLLNAVREGYKKDYEDIIRKYFDSLIEESAK